MSLQSRYGNIINLFQTTWFLPRHVVDKGVAIFERLGTPSYSIEREKFYETRVSAPLAQIPGQPFNPYSDDKETRILGRLGVHKTKGNVAVVPIYGVLAKRMSDFDISETGTSADMLADAFDILAANKDQFKSTILDVDSPGGSVLGTELAAQALLRLRQQMPVMAIANEIMASGGYYIGSHADELFVTPTSYIGSIGVYTTRVDMTKFYEDKGVKVYVISAGEYKTDRHPATPFTEEEGKRIQEEVNTYYGLFKQAVMRGRGISEAQIESLADGTLEIGENAVTRGFADGVSTLREMVEVAEAVGNKEFFTTGTSEMNMKTLFGRNRMQQNDASGDEVEEVTEATKAGIELHEQADNAEYEAEIAQRAAALKESEARLQEREEKIVQREIEMDFDALVSRGKILPAQRATLEAIAKNLRTSPQMMMVEVDEDGSTEEPVSAYDALIKCLGMGTKQVEFEEIAKTGNEPPDIDNEDPQAMADILIKVQKHEKISADEAYVFVRENGIPPYAVATNGN